ncbi:Conserved hypothetical protein [gamma proteobacterium HdN1]|nr:Conserved hypothetical protein [gamma proteobacterium HdN1]
MIFPSFSYFLNKLTANRIPEHWYTWLRYLISTRRFPRLTPPIKLSEKLLFLQMYERHPLRRVFADKLAVRGFIENAGYKNHLPNLYGEYTSFDEIDFNPLPNRYVVKGNHGCGFNFLVPDAKKLDKAILKKECSRWLSLDYYYFRREWYYRKLPRRLIIEEFIEGPNGNPPWDFKIFVANGTPFIITVDADRFSGHKRAVYDIHWNRLPIVYKEAPLEIGIERPSKLDDMLEAATRLSGGLSFVRVDFFVTPDTFYIGEITNLPGGGNLVISPDIWDAKLGEWFGACDTSISTQSLSSTASSLR